LSNRSLLTFDGLHVPEEFHREFFQLVDASSDSEKVYLKVYQLLNQLRITPIHILCYGENFEKLKTYKDLYSMRVKAAELNLRILFSYKSDGSILLHAFHEISGKKETGYEKHAAIAQKRLKVIKNE